MACDGCISHVENLLGLLNEVAAQVASKEAATTRVVTRGSQAMTCGAVRYWWQRQTCPNHHTIPDT